MALTAWWADELVTQYCGDALTVLQQIPSASVHMCVTSPPYWHLRDYQTPGQIGLEESPERYVETLVQIFAQVFRVLRDDGTCWIVIGDAYAGSWSAQSRANGNDLGSTLQGGSMLRARQIQAHARGQTHMGSVKHTPGLKPKDLIGLPWRVAFGLQANGWWLRSEIIWEKPSCMPESVRDRPTRSHETIFLLTKNERYFYDAEGIRERHAEESLMRAKRNRFGGKYQGSDTAEHGALKRGNGFGLEGNADLVCSPGGRNKRSVWRINPEPLAEPHFAAYPRKLVEPCILAGTSAHGCCPACWAPYRRKVDKIKGTPESFNGSAFTHGKTHDARAHLAAVGTGQRTLETTTTGWAPTCGCGFETVEPCTVLDPFAGAGTSLIVAAQLGRKSIGIELNQDYCALAVARYRRGTQLSLGLEASNA